VLDWQIMSVRRYLGILLASGLLSLAVSQPAYSQQPKLIDPQASKPPKIILKIAPSNSVEDSAPPKIEHLSDLAFRLLHYTGDAGCQKSNCQVLVTDFVFPDGTTIPNGVQWADELSLLFADQKNSTEVIDRSLFKDFWEKAHLSAKLQNSEPVARWMARYFDATVVLVGQARMITDDVVQLSARFLNASNENLISPSSEVNLRLTITLTAVSPVTELSVLPIVPPFPDTIDGEKIYRAGAQGVGLPSCYYTPSPPSTETSRSAKFSGTILIEGVVGLDGAMKAVRIVQGAPFGLNDTALEAIKSWKCKPATLEGKPVASFVPIEVTFRSFPQH
jgi:TonB family protein